VPSKRDCRAREPPCRKTYGTFGKEYSAGNVGKGRLKRIGVAGGVFADARGTFAR